MKTIAPDSTAMTYLYDNSGNMVESLNGSEKNTYKYKFDGQIDIQTKFVNNVQTENIEYFYDDLERLVEKSIVESIAGNENVDITMYTYNTMGNIEVVSSPDNFGTWYTRDKAERITKVKTDNKEITYEYFGDGLVKKITYPNSMTTEYIYDNANHVTSVVTKLGSTVLRNYSYTYDANGNVLTVSGSENVTYTYDALNRLASSTKNGVTTAYAYDSRNNLVSETDGTNTKTYEYGGDNRLHKVTENGTETVYEYDLNGNLIQRGEDIFSYDESNRLIYSCVNNVETIYKIGIEGLRSKKITNGEITTYNYNQSGQVLRENEDEFVYGNSLLGKKSGGKYYYYVHNAHGDVTAIVDESGNVVNSYEYDPWGEITSQTETVANNIKYSGEYYDEETGLIYLRNRYYDPNVRRFTTEDPARDDLNWYCYCGNNPVNFVDPSGLESQLDEYINTNYAGKKNITLVIKRPVSNSREAAAIEDGELKNGHSFIRLDDGNSNVQYIGFAATKKSLASMILGLNVDGKFVDDSKADWHVAKVYELTNEQYSLISESIENKKKNIPSYNIESYNCTTFAINTVKVGSAASGQFMTVKEHTWTLPNDMEQQLSNYKALPKGLPPKAAAWLVNNTMANFYGYTPADAAQDLKKAEGTVLLKYNGSITTITNKSYIRSKN